MRRIATRPTRNTIAFGALLLAMWYAALSQGNGAAYALFFFIVALALVSWLHARRNLRGLTLRAGRIEPVFAGSVLRVPLTLAASRGNFSCGVEVRATAGGEAVRCGFLAAGKTADLVLLAPAMQRGVFSRIEIEIRSLWPLGLFAVRALVPLDAPHLVQPAPAGAQPLPDGEPGWRYDRRKGRGDGDEFAGLREFRVGESPRRIDWRAAERSEKLLIKEWEGAAGGLRWLDWKDVLPSTDAEARLAQLARWVLDADRSGAPYGLRAPGVEIAPALGPAQRARCLHALAAFPGAPESAAPPRPRSPAPAILPGPLAGLLIALALAALPMLTTAQRFSAGLFGAAILFRFFTRRRGLALRSMLGKLFVLGVGVGGVLLSGAGLLGLEPGMSLVIALIALKVLESVTRREFFMLVLLTWFLALSGLFVSQTLPAATVAIALCALAAAAAAVLESDDHMSWPLALKRTAFMAGQGLPVIALLFLFFPRVQGGFRLSLTPGGRGAAGFSEDFDPGDFSQLNENFDTAFRAEFLDSEPPKSLDRYWRGVVLWECRGLSWRRGAAHAPDPRAPWSAAGALRQRITLQPHGARWLFALDRPLFAPKGMLLLPGGHLQSPQRINRSTRYEVLSQPGFHDVLLPREQRAAALVVPGNLPPQTRQLGESWKHAGADASILASGVRWFQAQNFTYSLTPQRYEGASGLDDFLFRRRSGFCAHYAGSFATLMRVAGVPARVVLGYQGGEYNPHGHYFLVRESDAHAWSEVWLEGRGWQRVDLTQQLAPGRIESGAESLREAVAAFGTAFRAPAGLRDLFAGAGMLWDDLNYQWDLHVVSYDEDAQFEFIADLGLKDLPRPVLLGGIFVATGVLLGLAGLWLRRATRAPRDAAAEAWSRACAQIARLSGVAREPWEGPHAYAERASTARPESADIIRAAAELYARIRFAAAPPAVAELRAATKRLAAL